jgi:hypothetical protein
VTWGERLRSYFPWGIDSGIRSSLLTLACGIGLIVTWYGVSGEGVFQDQIPWLSAGIVILMVSLYGQATLILRGRRAIGERRGRLICDSLLTLEPVLATGGASRTLSTSTAPTTSTSTVADIERVVIVDGLTLFHAPDCPMITGRDVRVVTKHAAGTAGLEPCGICLHSPPVTNGRTS